MPQPSLAISDIDLSTNEGCSFNNNCIFCGSFSRDRGHNDYINPQDSETKEIKLYLYRLRLEKVEGVNFTASGGEPTIRSDIIELLSYANNLGYKYILLQTNGRMFCYPEFTKRVVQSGCSYVTISLHASNAKLHDKITMAPGSFEQTVQGIKNLLAYQSRVKVRIIILFHKLNYTNLYAIAQFISKEFKGIHNVEFLSVGLRGVDPTNRKELGVRMSVVEPHLEKAFGVLKRDGFPFLISDIPFCIIDRKYWKNKVCRVKNGSKYKFCSKRELIFFESCNGCVMKEKCPGVWDDYTSWFGTSEFKPIKSM
jgi:molybdenum cofactor biosynthesis enzyme MoaA